MDFNWIFDILFFLPIIGYYCWKNVYDFNDLADCMDAIDTNKATIFISYQLDIEEDLDILATTALKIIQGGSINVGKFSIRNATYQWTVSPADADEYFLELAGGGDPGLSDPLKVYENDVLMDIGVLGALAVGEWNYGDNDAHGWDTIYVRIIGSGDPDAQAVDYVEAGYVVTINGWVEAGAYQIFTGEGSIVLGAHAAAASFPEWWTD